MTPPRQLLRIEWEAARRFHEPDVREHKSRTFHRLDAAAEQVAIIACWPSHMTLIGVYRPRGYEGRDDLGWESVDPDELVRQHLSPFAADQLALRIADRANHPDPAVRALADVVPLTSERIDR